MTVRRLAAAALVLFLCVTGALSPQPARADWVPIPYSGSSFCNGSYTQDQLEYVTQPVLAVYSVTFIDEQHGIYEINPTTNYRTDPAQWRVQPVNGFSTVPVQFTAAGNYLVFFQYSPTIWDDAFVSLGGPATDSFTFTPDGVYSGTSLVGVETKPTTTESP